MNRFKFFYLIFLVVFCCSCGKYDEIKITDVSGINIKGFDNNALLVSLKMEVDNPTMNRIKITELDTRLFLNNQYVGKLLSEDKVVLPPKSKKKHELNLRIRVANFLGTALRLMSLKQGDKVKVRLEGTITARTLLMKREIPIDEAQDIVI